MAGRLPREQELARLMDRLVRFIEERPDIVNREYITPAFGGVDAATINTMLTALIAGGVITRDEKGYFSVITHRNPNTVDH